MTHRHRTMHAALLKGLAPIKGLRLYTPTKARNQARRFRAQQRALFLRVLRGFQRRRPSEDMVSLHDALDRHWKDPLNRMDDYDSTVRRWRVRNQQMLEAAALCTFHWRHRTPRCGQCGASGSYAIETPCGGPCSGVPF